MFKETCPHCTATETGGGTSEPLYSLSYANTVEALHICYSCHEEFVVIYKPVRVKKRTKRFPRCGD